jgi:hypothetical protein
MDGWMGGISLKRNVTHIKTISDEMVREELKL